MEPAVANRPFVVQVVDATGLLGYLQIGKSVLQLAGKIGHCQGETEDAWSYLCIVTKTGKRQAGD